MTSWIISGVDANLEEIIRDLAWQEGIPINQAVLRLVEMGAQALHSSNTFPMEQGAER